MTLTIVVVQSRADLREFIAVPRVLYAGMAGFVAPLDHEREMMLDRKKASFFTHGEACYWLARRDGRAVGRISAQIDRLSTAPAAAGCGFFGCLDTIDDAAVVQALMATAEDWIRAQGRRAAQGPYLLSINGEAGLLVDGHDEPPTTLMPWHPPYLAGLLAGCGYASVQTLFAFRLDLAALDLASWQRMTGRRSRAGTAFTLRGLRVKQLAAEGKIARALFNDAWSGNWGFAPLAEADVTALRTGFQPFLYADCAVVAERGGTPVGFILALPNMFDIIADLGGKLGLTGWPRFLYRMLRGRYRHFRVLLMGIAAQYRDTPLGAEIAVAMVTDMVGNARRRNLRSIEAGWVLEQNVAMIRILQALGFRRNRTYAVYQKPI